MPLYRTGPDVSLDDLIARIESAGEKVDAMTRVGNEWTVVTSLPANDTGHAHLPSWAKETR